MTPPGNLHINLFFMVNVGIRVAKSKPSGGIKFESPLLLSPADLVLVLGNSCFQMMLGV